MWDKFVDNFVNNPFVSNCSIKQNNCTPQVHTNIPLWWRINVFVLSRLRKNLFAIDDCPTNFVLRQLSLTLSWPVRMFFVVLWHFQSSFAKAYTANNWDDCPGEVTPGTFLNSGFEPRCWSLSSIVELLKTCHRLKTFKSCFTATALFARFGANNNRGEGRFKSQLQKWQGSSELMLHCHLLQFLNFQQWLQETCNCSGLIMLFIPKT